MAAEKIVKRAVFVCYQRAIRTMIVDDIINPRHVGQFIGGASACENSGLLGQYTRAREARYGHWTDEFIENYADGWLHC